MKVESILSQLPYETIPKTEVNYGENQDLRAYNISINGLVGIKVYKR